jgi:hypothetical protein
MPSSGPVNYKFQLPGAGLELLGAGALSAYPKERWIGLGLLIIGAFLIAFPIVRWSVTTHWRKCAAALLVTMGAFAGWFLLDIAREDEPFQFDPRIEAVVGKKFKNETISVDGQSYRNTTFENVTLLYNGVAPWEFATGVVFKGDITLRTENPSIFFYERLAMTLRNHPHLRRVSIGNVDKDGNIRDYTYSVDGRIQKAQ